MYAKLFAQVVSSSLTHNETIEVRGVFFMMLAIADREGNVPGVDRSIARLINVPVEVFERAVERLMSPDSESQSPDEDGRRIVRLEAGKGYRIVNYEKYSGIVTDAERRTYFRLKQQEHRQRKRLQELQNITEGIRAGSGASKSLLESFGGPGEAFPEDSMNGQEVGVGVKTTDPGVGVGGMLERAPNPPNRETVFEAAKMDGVAVEVAEDFYHKMEEAAQPDANGRKVWVRQGPNGCIIPITNWRASLARHRGFAANRKNERRFGATPKPAVKLNLPPRDPNAE